MYEGKMSNESQFQPLFSVIFFSIYYYFFLFFEPVSRTLEMMFPKAVQEEGMGGGV